MYSIIIEDNRIDINTNQIVKVEINQKAENIEEEHLLIVLVSDIKFHFYGQDAIDMLEIYENEMLPHMDRSTNVNLPLQNNETEIN